MPVDGSWHTLLEELDELPDGAPLISPLSFRRFRITDVQEHRVIVAFEDGDESRPLRRDQFETLYRRIAAEAGGFELDRLPPDADPFSERRDEPVRSRTRKRCWRPWRTLVSTASASWVSSETRWTMHSR